jgi:enoyl-CoA hydratase/carnithine racemase
VRSTREQVHHYEHAVDEANDASLNCSKPVIAAVEGYCVGGGLGLAMACDFRVALPGSKLFIPATKMSIVYGLRETQTLLALVGLTQAKRILYMGERIDSSEALRIGLLDEVSDAADMDGALSPWLEKFRLAAPLTVAGSKRILNSLDITVTEPARIEAEALIKAAGESQDYHEGRAAFAEKRAPVFKGC